MIANSIYLVLLGFLFGRLGIYAHEAPFAGAIELTQPKYAIFNKYLEVFKMQWNAVGWSGCIMLACIIGCHLIARKERK